MEKVETMPDHIRSLTVSQEEWNMIMGKVRAQNMTMKVAVPRYCKY